MDGTQLLPLCLKLHPFSCLRVPRHQINYRLLVQMIKFLFVVYREALHVYATAGGTAARVGATVPTVDPE
jgi:hypothetical protein